MRRRPRARLRPRARSGAPTPHVRRTGPAQPRIRSDSRRADAFHAFTDLGTGDRMDVSGTAFESAPEPVESLVGFRRIEQPRVLLRVDLSERGPCGGTTTPGAGALGDEGGEVLGEGLCQLMLGPPACSRPAYLRIAVTRQATSGLGRGGVRCRRGGRRCPLPARAAPRGRSGPPRALAVQAGRGGRLRTAELADLKDLPTRVAAPPLTWHSAPLPVEHLPPRLPCGGQHRTPSSDSRAPGMPPPLPAGPFLPRYDKSRSVGTRVRSR